jgi:hypothetical protein
MTLKDFAGLEIARRVQLDETHIAELRLYSSQAFRRFNSPLRRKQKPHPFANTTFFLSEGIKKLRVLHADERQRSEFWRGMGNLMVDSSFVEKGGTELGCMSHQRPRAWP